MENSTQYLKRAHSLMNVGRFEMALQEIEKAMQDNPENGDAWLLRIICFTELKKYEAALEIARKMLTYFPEAPIFYYYIAINLFYLDESLEAEEVSKAGLSVAPNYVDFYSLLGQIYLEQKKWELALSSADEGLELEPQDVNCLNVRVQALTKLGRIDELKHSMEETLHANPNDAYSHANIGWSKLETKDYESAKQHFAEALQINPNFEEARLGLLEALKAKNLFYRLFLNWIFWISKRTEQNQWVVIIGLYLGFRLLKGFARQYPVLVPVVFVVAFLFYLTWIMSPLFNLLIKFDKTARHALTPEESAAANIVGVGILLGITSFLCMWIFDLEAAFIWGMVSLSLVIPGTMYYDFKNTTHEFHAKISLIALGGLGIGGSIFIAMDEIWGGLKPLIAMALPAYFLGFLLYQFAANYWRLRAKPNR